jgi:hypothetical protein
MKKLLAVAALSLSAAPAVRAQCPDSAAYAAAIARNRERVSMERLFRGITLSADQRSAAVSIFRRTLPHLQALSRFDRDSIPRQDELIEERNGEMKALLVSETHRAAFAVNAASGEHAFILDPGCPTAKSS